ncbi:MAG: prepilin-type N-terminal cleavage/methylation domain-containing protein [Verrucomicrobiales bacterium]|jgi:prepilin-type N-terminal cleavage/methylation domain-containing protein
MKTTKSTRQAGFTLLELLIVISIIAILAAIAFPATSLVMNQARKAQASQQVSGIVNAIKLFETQYSVLPISGSGGEEEIDTDQAFVDILTGVDTTGNPKGTPFLEGREAKKARGNKPARAGLVQEGNGSQSLVDPWGNYYVVKMDANDDNEIDVPERDNPVRAKAVAWCYGKPTTASDAKSAQQNPASKWLTSWK